jgi:ribosome-binding ATPase YchF (GTP1/OBG family)
VLSGDSRHVAAVAAHPFTTIEPNVGAGWWSSTEESNFKTHFDLINALESEKLKRVPEELRGAFYGRDPWGGRYLPLIVKDVAGLVPGAYKGRGKGNKFLGDICDADVLVHVIDASGKSDKDGNVITEFIDGCNPMEDAEWIREELHRWIYGNVIAKWASVVRKGSGSALNRLGQIFSGYQGPRSCIYNAVRYSSLDIKNVAQWTKHDVHNLVAHYLAVRFPICLALNKIDCMDDLQFKMIPLWQKKAFDRGEAAIPVCAMAESWKLTQRAEYQRSDGSITESSNRSWDIVNERLGIVGTQGVLLAISAAVMLRPPILCYPVSDLQSESPIGLSDVSIPESTSLGDSNRLVDCIQLKPGSTVEDVFEGLKRGALARVQITGDFVRAEAKGLQSGSRKKQLGRDAVIDESNSIIKIQTNRKSLWQTESKFTA